MKRILPPLVVLSITGIAFLSITLWRGLHIHITNQQGPLTQNRVALIHLNEMTNLCGGNLPFLEKRQLSTYKKAIRTIGRSWKLRYNKGNIHLKDIVDPYERELFSIYLRLKELYSHETRNRNRLPRPYIRSRGLPHRNLLLKILHSKTRH